MPDTAPPPRSWPYAIEDAEHGLLFYVFGSYPELRYEPDAAETARRMARAQWEQRELWSEAA